MIRNLIILLAFFSLRLSAQTSAQIDSLSVEMCKTLEATKAVGDSISVQLTLQKHMPAFYSKFKFTDEAAFDELSEKIYFRFQKNCRAFVELLSRLEEVKGDWMKLEGKPKIVLSKKECAAITDIKKFYYLESNGSRVNVTIDNGIWLEEFEDNTFSKLHFRWKNNCRFEIEFIESNNNSRKKFSSKGDKYNYGIYDKADDGYKVYVDNEQGVYIGFILHIAK